MSQDGSNADKKSADHAIHVAVIGAVGAIVAALIAGGAVWLSRGGGSGTNLAAVTTSSQRITSPNSSSPTSAPSTTGSASVPNESPVCATGSIELVGSTAFEPIAQKAAAAYTQACPHATITVSGGDAAYGLTQVRDAVKSGSRSMIAMYDGLSTDAGGLRPAPMGYLIFSVVAHTGLFPESGLTTGELRKIFVKPGELGVVAVGRRAGSGTRLTFITKVLGVNPGAPDVTPDKGNCPSPTGSAFSLTSCTEDSTPHLLNFVNGTPNAIGYAEAYGLLNYSSQVSAIKIDGVAPMQENVLNGSYKFWTVEHLYAAMQPATLAKDFLAFLPQYIKSNPPPDFIACSDAPKTLEADCHSAILTSPRPILTSPRPILTSPHPKSVKSAPPAFDILSIGSLVTLGILIIYAFTVAFRWRRQPRVVKRPWWQWLGCGLALVAAVWATLWSVYFLGSGALDWVVPLLAAIGISLFGHWYQHTSKMVTPPRRDSNVTSHRRPGPDSASVISRQIVTDPNGRDLTIAQLGKVINIVSGKLGEKGQIDSIVSASNLGLVRYPTGRADSRELWIAVFEAALDEPRGTLDLLLHNIRNSLGTLSGSAFEDALREVGLS